MDNVERKKIDGYFAVIGSIARQHGSVHCQLEPTAIQEVRCEKRAQLRRVMDPRQTRTGRRSYGLGKDRAPLLRSNTWIRRPTQDSPSGKESAPLRQSRCLPGSQ